MNHVRFFILLLAIISLSGFQVIAQESKAAIFGTVTDPNGSVVPGTVITATQISTNLSFTATTNQDGQYRIVLLPIGSYKLSYSAPNFAKTEQSDFVLRVGEERRADVKLSIDTLKDSIEIESPLTESAQATLSTVIPAERVENLPLNGRQIQELALTAPGVSAGGGFRSTAFNQFGLATPSDGNGGAFSVNGGGSRSNGFFLDGADINIPEQGVIAFPPLVESIREFQIQTNNFSAEFGRYSGSIINYVTKSGTNSWRGSVYEYFRNTALDANDPFNKAAGLERPVLQLNQYGVAIGGPIFKDRFFIFGNFEGNRTRQGTGPFTNNVPTSEERNGQLSFTNFTDSNNNGVFDAGEATFPDTTSLVVNPITTRILNGFIPLPNTNSPGANFLANGTNSLDEDAFTIRGDYRLSDKDLLTARYSYDNQNQFFPFDIFFVSASLPAFPFANPEKRQSFSGSYARNFTSNFTNEFRFGLNDQVNPIPSGTTIDPASIGLPNGAPQNEFGRGLPIIRVTGFGGTGGQPLTDNLGASTTTRRLFQFIDNVTWSLKNHSLKFGGEVRDAEVNSQAFRALRGALTFNGSLNGFINPTVPGNAPVAALADFLLGRPSQATISSTDPERIFQTSALSLYLQDEWRVTNRLNLSLGLRYEIDTPLTEREGRISNLIPGVGNFVVGSSELPRLHEIDTNNFAPRFGIAYRLTEDGKNVIRGGGGIFYDNGVFQDRFSTARTNAPFAVTNINNTPVPFPATGSATTLTSLIGSGAATGAASIATDFKTAYAAQWNLNFQRQITKSTVAEIAYVGRRGQNLSRQVNINQRIAVNSPLAQTSSVNARPFAGTNIPVAARFANDIIQQQSTADSIYHALQVKVERRLSRGSSFLAAYTWSKSLDTASGIGTGSDDRPQDSFNLDAQRAVSNFDIPHRFIFSSTFALPFGKGQKYLKNASGILGFLVNDWQINSISTLQSGQPFTVTVGTFDSDIFQDVFINGILTRVQTRFGTNISNRRPNLISDPSQNVPLGFAFNPQAFAIPADRVIGVIQTNSGPISVTSSQLGNAGRGIVRGDSYFNSDLGILRTFQLPFLGEGRSLRFRSEFFNLYNTVNFTAPVTSLSSQAFGRFVSNATSPRVIQFSLKLNF